MRIRTRPETTLFMLMSVDGKISTGDTDKLDVDKDYPKITGIKEGLHQYYDLEKKTDFFSLNTGRVMAKIGVNTKTPPAKQIPCRFIIIDNKPHLTAKGVDYLTKWVKHLYLVTTNEKHPALKSSADNITVIKDKNLNLPDLFKKFYVDYKIKRITIQSGGTLNASLIREGLIDHLSIVVAPAIIGGKDTSTLADGESLHNHQDLRMIKALELTEVRQLEHSYVLMRYDVSN